MRRAWFAAIALATSGTTWSMEQTDDVLLLDTVYESTAQHFPRLLELLAVRDQADAEVLEAQGAFDTNVGVNGFSRASGFWDGQLIQSEVKRRLSNSGATVYGGYKISEGAFPIYEDINFTNTAGELKAGVLFPFLRDRNIDSFRFKLNDARLNIDQVDMSMLEAQIDVHSRAQLAYWRWVNAGRKLEVYESLLSIAEQRDTAMRRQVDRGAMAAISLTENQQNITRRQLLVAGAERDLGVAANYLALFVRNQNGMPRTPQRKQLPSSELMDQLIPEFSVADRHSLIETALTNRPELRALDVELSRVEQSLLFAENNLKPRLDLKLEVSHDFGAISEGGSSRDSTDTVLSVDFSVPIQRRAARGQISGERAKLRALQLERQRITEQLRVHMENSILELMVSQDLVKLSNQEVVQADTLTDAERKRFQNGASDFFLVNIRESNAADARIRLYRARLRQQTAQTTLDAATLRFDRLGITPMAQ